MLLFGVFFSGSPDMYVTSFCFISFIFSNPFQFYLLSFCFLCLFWSVLHNPYCVFSSTSLPLYSLSFLCYFSLLRLSSRPISSPLVLYLPLKSYISALISFTEPLFQKYFKFTGIGLVINFLFSSSISFLWQHFSGEWFLSVNCFYCYSPPFLLYVSLVHFLTFELNFSWSGCLLEVYNKRKEPGPSCRLAFLILTA